MFRLKQTTMIEKHLNLKHSVLRISSTEIITCTHKDKVLDDIEILKERWNSEFSDLREFRILDSEISSSGLSLNQWR